jgi:serine protease Do
MKLELSPALKTFLLGLFLGGLADRVFVLKPLDYLAQRQPGWKLPATSSNSTQTTSELAQQLSQVSSVEDIVEVSSKAVVTISIQKEQRVFEPQSRGIFDFGFGAPSESRIEEIKQDIGTGFVVDSTGLIVTNKHVVGDTQATYTVIDKDNHEYQVTRIYRDPTNDLAIIKVEGANLPALPLGDSDKIRVGQDVIAIGTALGEFRHTVTTGVVSGLGRGIEATDGFGFESLEGVIQTDAAINPGNSGGPLLDASGSVIGVSVAVSAGAENIGFAIPINVVRASLDNFNKTGQFDRPFFGVRYQLITKQAALMNEVPQGAYVLEVVTGSSASDAGVQAEDIITHFDGQAVTTESTELASLINGKKLGDKVQVKVWRNDQELTLEVTLKISPN